KRDKLNMRQQTCGRLRAWHPHVTKSRPCQSGPHGLLSQSNLTAIPICLYFCNHYCALRTRRMWGGASMNRNRKFIVGFALSVGLWNSPTQAATYVYVSNAEDGTIG